MFFTLLVGFIVLFCIWDHFHRKHSLDLLHKSKIDGRFVWPLVGNAFAIRGINSENLGLILSDLLKQYNKRFYSFIFYQVNVLTADAKDLEVLLNSPTLITKNNVYDMLSVWLGNGLLMSTGKKWHTRRKITTPTFHFKILEQFVEIFDQQSNTLAEKLRPVADGETVVDMFPLVCLQALDIIAETAMGVQINAQTQSEVGYVKSVKNVTNIIAQRLQNPMWRFDWLFRLNAPDTYKAMMEDINLMQSFTKDVIQKRRVTLEKSLKEQKDAKATELEEQDIGQKRRMALLDVLLQATVDGQPLSNEDIREEVETFMFEGHDTTTSGTSFVLYEIARHPEIQAKLFQEIREVMGDDKDSPVTYRQLQDLKYMECVLKESMRMYPPVPIVGRYFNEDTEINNKIIPRNTHFNMAFFAVLRDPDYFENPDTFNPDRFLPENAEKISTFAYIPFSAGPRNCIGQKYAMLEMKSTVSKILRHYELLPLGPEAILSFSLILRSANGNNLGLKPRVYN